MILVICIFYGGTISDIMDNFDIKILSKLLNNCRESDRQIGIDLGMSGGAVNARIRKMQKLEILEEFIVQVEPPVLGYGVLYFVISGENMKEILEQLSLVGEPHFVAPCVGGITVCSIIVKENLEQKIELAKKLMKDFKLLSIFEAENPGFNTNLTKTDLQILEELLKNPRQKIETIARNTKMSTKTITRCIEKLQENEGIQFTTIYDPKKIKKYIPLSKRQDKPDSALWLIKHHSLLKDSQIAKLVGVTKNSVSSIKNKSYWNYNNLNPKDPVALGLFSQKDLIEAIEKAERRIKREKKQKEKAKLTREVSNIE